MQGAGGVGGLLSVTSHSALLTSHFPAYDGNGNVSEYLASSGSISAHFEYDPFGNTVVNTDTSNQFAYRFSTKPLDQTTGLCYYGYRYYDSVTGRWPSRDLIQEKGGLNLYGFVANDGLRKTDYLGLACKQKAGSFVWIKELELSKVELEFERAGNGGLEFRGGKAIFKGRAMVTCCCDNSGERDAAGNITATADVPRSAETDIYFETDTGSPIGVATSVGDGVAQLVSQALESILPPGIRDPGNSAQSLIDLIKSVTPENEKWDNEGKNPCQKLIDK